MASARRSPVADPHSLYQAACLFGHPVCIHAIPLYVTANGIGQGYADRLAGKVLLKRAGRVSIPYLVDPNTGIEMAESEDIIRYLIDTYTD